MKKFILMSLTFGMLASSAFAQSDASTGAMGSGTNMDSNPVMNAPTAADPQMQQDATGTNTRLENDKTEMIKKKSSKTTQKKVRD